MCLDGAPPSLVSSSHPAQTGSGVWLAAQAVLCWPNLGNLAEDLPQLGTKASAFSR